MTLSGWSLIFLPGTALLQLTFTRTPKRVKLMWVRNPPDRIKFSFRKRRKHGAACGGSRLDRVVGAREVRGCRGAALGLDAPAHAASFRVTVGAFCRSVLWWFPRGL